MTSYGVGDQNYSPDDSDDLSRSIAKVMSPTPAAQLVGPPPDIAPKTAPGVSTPQTGTLNYAPIHAVAKNMDTAAGRQQYSTAQMQGVSRPPNDGVVNSISQAPVSSAVSPIAPIKSAVQPIVPQGQPQPVNPDPNASLRPGGSGAGPMPVLPATARQVNAPTPLDQAQSKLSNYVNSGSGVSQIQNPFLRGLARVGDVAGSILAPGVAAQIPGTTLHNRQLIAQESGIVGGLQGQQQAAAQLEDTQSQTAQRAAAAAKATAQAGADTPRPVTADEARAAGNPALEGSVMKPSDIGKVAVQGVKNTGQIDKQDDQDSVQAQNAQSLADVRQTQGVLNQAKADAANADPSTPAGKMAIAKLRAAQDGHSAAMVRAQAAMINAQSGAFGTYNGQPLPGAMLTDQGAPVGSHFQGNVRPTGQERNKTDMANSARDQLNDIKSIVQKHPTMFGPGYGQAAQFKQWLGSGDPDAQRFIAARTIAGDHLAGTFGGRSEAALTALDNAIGQFKTNPKAMQAGLDQLLKANTTFQKAGTVRTVGSNAAKTPVQPVKPGAQLPGHEVWVRGKDGKLVKQ